MGPRPRHVRGVPELRRLPEGLRPLRRARPARKAARAWLLRGMEGRFGIQMDTLRRFNAKFCPRWVPRYLVYRSTRDLPAIGLAALSAEGFLPFDAARNLRPRTARKATELEAGGVTLSSFPAAPAILFDPVAAGPDGGRRRGGSRGSRNRSGAPGHRPLVACQQRLLSGPSTLAGLSRGEHIGHASRLHPRSLAARHQLGPLARPVPRGRLRADRARLARRTGHGRRGPRATRSWSPTSASTTSPTTTPASSTASTQPPVIIGHSFGGLITEKLLGQGIGAAGVAIDPAQIKGVLPLPLAQLRSGLPALGNPANLHRSVSLTAEGVPLRLRQRAVRGGVRRAVRAVDDPVAGPAAVPGRGGQLRRCTREAKVDTDNETRGPLLLISGTADHTVPDVVTRSTFKQYRDSTAVTELKQFEGRGHSLTIDSGWSEVADLVPGLAEEERPVTVHHGGPARFSPAGPVTDVRRRNQPEQPGGVPPSVPRQLVAALPTTVESVMVVVAGLASMPPGLLVATLPVTADPMSASGPELSIPPARPSVPSAVLPLTWLLRMVSEPLFAIPPAMSSAEFAFTSLASMVAVEPVPISMPPPVLLCLVAVVCCG